MNYYPLFRLMSWNNGVRCMSFCTFRRNGPLSSTNKDLALPTVYPKKYAHGFVVLCFVVVMQSFIMNSHEVFIHIHQGCFAGTGAIVRLLQCQWSKPDGYEKISQFITTTKHSKAKTVCIFLGIHCTLYWYIEMQERRNPFHVLRQRRWQQRTMTTPQSLACAFTISVCVLPWVHCNVGSEKYYIVLFYISVDKMLHRIQERKITIEYVQTNLHTTRYFCIRGFTWCQRHYRVFRENCIKCISLSQ